ncbi:D-inositol-3-phosphate glycosyltransferase [subsurface metagenome]
MNSMTLAASRWNWFTNVVSSRIEKPYSLLFYVIESAEWVIRRIGIDVTTNLNNQKLLKARSTTIYKDIHNQIIHFGSVNTFLTSEGFRIPNKSNKVVLTWFHVMPDDPRIRFVKEAQKYVDVVHTASTITKEKLIEIGIPEEKIVVIPLGVDLNLFKPVSPEEKQKIREKLGIPKTKLVVGSFQKDGVGWEEGLKLKWVKGPDIFVEVIHKLRMDYDIVVLLTGPARGYIKRELDRIGVPYKHFFLKNYLEIPKYYNALDLYLVASRVEGGPKAILEAMATGVPLVSTKVGIAGDIIREGYNGLLADVEDVETLSDKASKIIEGKKLANRLIDNASNTIRNYSWENIAKEYYEKIYKRFLNR